ncbi:MULTISPECIES: MFS transporter [unclassified Streptomyces]|uniref:MFS transporter n=1 Tax=unclassified Streptomyces TaxID=2593676 RepID=UPI002E2AB576|nr:MFS transporter [Streptomyces sp. NBC_00223]
MPYLDLAATGRRSGLALALACVTSFLVVLDAMIVSVALPAMRTDLGLADASAPWVINCYTLTFAGVLLLGGRCVDIFGAWRLLGAGTALFTVTSLAAGLAANAPELLACRAAQGVGAALMMPAALAALTATFTEPSERTRALSVWSAVAALGAAAGPILGGVLTSTLGWRWVFFVNVPLGAVAVLGAVALAQPLVRPGRRPRLDVVGAVLITTGLLAVVYAVMRSSGNGWSDLGVVGSAGSGAVLLAVFLVHQAKVAPEPLFALALLRLRSVAGANAVMFLLGLGFVSSLLILSLDMQYATLYSPLRAGLGFLPVGVGMMAGARGAGHLTERIGPRLTTAVCCTTGAVGLAWSALALDVDRPYVLTIGLPGVLFGLGGAAAFTPLTVSATRHVPPSHQGAAAGLLSTVRQTSGALGVAVLSTVAISWSGDEAAGGTSVAGRVALTHGYAVALGLAAGLLLAAAVVAVVGMPKDV